MNTLKRFAAAYVVFLVFSGYGAVLAWIYLRHGEEAFLEELGKLFMEVVQEMRAEK